MDWQQPASLAVVALAGFLLVRREIRSRRRARSRACGSDCGCESGEAPGTGGALLKRSAPADRVPGGRDGAAS